MNMTPSLECLLTGHQT